MNDQILRKIQMDIRKNFGKRVNWNNIPKGNFNCYMFAIFNTVPTEILDHEENGENYLVSCINEDISYFGKIGQISGNTEYKNKEELVYAVKSDLKCLGIRAERCSTKEVMRDGETKIAIYADTKALKRKEHVRFHFMRQDGYGWSHKLGWSGEVETVNSPIEYITFQGLKFIGCFRLSLIPDYL